MISTSGLPGQLALKLIESKRADFQASIEKNKVNAKEIEAFRSRISDINSPAELVADFEVYSFVMKAFDLEDQIFGKAMMRKVLESAPEDSSSLINKMTKSTFRTLFNEVGFGGTYRESDDGKVSHSQPDRFTDPDWIEEMVDRYVGAKLVKSELENNEIVGQALYAQSKAEELKSWYTVLADTKLRDFFYTALGLPDSMASVDLDAQVKTLSKKFDLKTFSDPEVMAKMTRRYVAIAEANAANENMASNPILQLFSNTGQQAIVSLNLDSYMALKANRY